MSETDLFTVLRKRHACRQFEPKPIPKQIMDKLVYSAHRAPTGGNASFRFVIVVDDPVTLRMLKLASPGYIGESTAAIVICTNLKEAATGLGRLGADQCSLYDAGAAAENVVLAAYALGLGASFVKSYSETAVRKILNLPQGSRTELIISLGYPAKNEPPPVKARKGGKVTHHNNYGKEWGGDDSKSGDPPRANHSILTWEQQIFELALFLITSAQGCVTEPHLYGPLRLIDAIGKLAELHTGTDQSTQDQFLTKIKSQIDANIDQVLVSDEEFVKFIDGLVDQFTDELRKRSDRVK